MSLRRGLLVLALPALALAAPDSTASLSQLRSDTSSTASPSPHRDSGRSDTAGIPVPGLDTASARGRQALRPPSQDSASHKPKPIPKRILTFKEQLFFALVFMSYIALVLTSLSNVNP